MPIAATAALSDHARLRRDSGMNSLRQYGVLKKAECCVSTEIVVGGILMPIAATAALSEHARPRRDSGMNSLRQGIRLPASPQTMNFSHGFMNNDQYF